MLGFKPRHVSEIIDVRQATNSFRTLSDCRSSPDMDCKDGTTSSWFGIQARKLVFQTDDHVNKGRLL